MYHLKCVKAWLVDTNVDNRIGLKHVYRRRLRRQSRIEFLLPLFHEIGLGKFVVIQVAVLLVLELSPSLAHAVRRDELYVVVCNTLSPPRVAVIFPASNTLSVAIISVR